MAMRPSNDVTRYRALRRKLARQFIDCARHIEALVPRVHLHLEPTGVHDLRVTTRRLRALVWVARRVGPRSACKRLRRLLREWGQALGERRALDVVLQDAAELSVDASVLVERHSLAADAVRRVVTVESGLELAALLRKTAGKLPKWSERRLHQGLVLCAQTLHKALREATHGKEQQHLLRIQAKKVRYVLEAIGGKCDALRVLQAQLGRSHDMEMLQTMLGPQAKADRIEASVRKRAVAQMHAAVKAAEEELRTAAARLRGTRGHA